MTRLRRRSRTVYRIYGEDEYLAGAGMLTAWEDAAPAADCTRGRGLRRIAGAAALTGAVGTVGGVVGLAGPRAHSADHRELAQRLVPSVRTASSRGYTVTRASTPAHAARRQIAHPSPSRQTRRRRGTSVRAAHGPGSRAETAETATQALAVSAPPVGTARYASAEARAGTRAQSEFGFER